VLALLFVVACLVGSYFYLKSYTKLDEAMELPDFQGYEIVEAEQLLKNMGLNPVVVDSLYLPNKRGGEIVDQDPTPFSNVKPEREIYLTIARYSAPMVTLPNLLNQTLPLAIAKIETYDLEIGELSYESNECTGCVIRIMANGEEIEPGDHLEKGSTINLIVGEGATGEKIDVPILYGLGIDEAQQLLNNHGLNVGATPYLDCETEADSLSAKVFRQAPEPQNDNKIARGSSIDLYLSSDLSRIPPVDIDSLKSLLK